jgi:hypothetical protein
MTSRLIIRTFLVSTLSALCACSGMRIVENTPAGITVRYDGFGETLEDATVAANKACASYGKTAVLRRNAVRTAAARYAHFDCVQEKSGSLGGVRIPPDLSFLLRGLRSFKTDSRFGGSLVTEVAVSATTVASSEPEVGDRSGHRDRRGPLVRTLSYSGLAGAKKL